MTAVVPFLPFAGAALWHIFSVFLRVAAVAALLPAFGERSIPTRVRLGVGFAFTFIAAPSIARVQMPDDPGAIVVFALAEIAIGVSLGMGLRLFILALQTAGAIAAQSTSLSQLLGGAMPDPLPAIGYVLTTGAMALAVMTGLHVKVAALLILSYDMLPVGQFPDGSSLSTWGLKQISNAFSLAFTLSAPFLILSVIYNLALGAINRAMPQLMVAFVGAPLITAGGLALLSIASPFMLSAWINALDAFLANPFAITP